MKDFGIYVLKHSDKQVNFLKTQHIPVRLTTAAEAVHADLGIEKIHTI